MGQLISFEERAVATLRDRLGEAQTANQDLIAFARGHHGATGAIHTAVLALMDADSLDALLKVVTAQWPKMLGVDHIALALVADGKAFRVHAGGVGTVEPRIVDRAIERLDSVTMRGVDCGHPLFGEDARTIRSEVLILIDADAPLPYGLLMLGQASNASMENAHGKQLLGFLGASLGAMLRRWLVTN
nr:DUF484 family protein [uncultured Sphingomonas sp.]